MMRHVKLGVRKRYLGTVISRLYRGNYSRKRWCRLLFIRSVGADQWRRSRRGCVMAYRDDPPLAQSEGGWVAAVVSAVTGRSSARRNVIDFRTAWRPRCPEIECVRAFLPWQVIAAAERRAEEIGL